MRHSARAQGWLDLWILDLGDGIGQWSFQFGEMRGLGLLLGGWNFCSCDGQESWHKCDTRIPNIANTIIFAELV